MTTERVNVVMEHFQNPRNVGTLETPDAIGHAGSPEEGGFVVLQLRLEDERIAEARFQTFGCGYAIAASSVMTEWAVGKRLEEATSLTGEMLLDLLGEVPGEKRFCAELAVAALRDALRVETKDRE